METNPRGHSIGMKGGGLGCAVVVACACGCSGGGTSGPMAADNDSGAGSDGEILALPTPGTPTPVGGPGMVSVNDAAAAIDPAATYAVTLAMNPFPVGPGQEVYKCQDFANPFQGQAVDIVRYELEMNPGSHHMLLFYSPGATSQGVVDCPMGGLQLGPYTFGAQSQKATQQYPDGIGAAIPAGMGFTANAHYVNSGSAPIMAAVKVTMFVARPGVVTQHAGVVQFILTTISIPATGQPYTVTGSCPLSQDMNLLWASSHMHQRATHFIANSGGTTLFETSQWSDPPEQAFSPPLALKANAMVDWACTYVNDTGSPLTFGQSAVTNAMCNFGATFYPVMDPADPVVRCLM